MSSPIAINPLIHFVIELQHSGLEVRLLLNGIDLHSGVPADKKIVQQKVNGWMTSSENELALYAGIPDSANIPNPLDLKCLVFRGPQGRQPAEEEALARFAERDKAKLPNGSIQLVWKTSFASDPSYGPWRWEAARPISADVPTIASAMQLILSAVTVLRQGDSTGLVRLLRIYVDESARAYGVNAGRLEAQVQAMCDSSPRVQSRDPVPEDYSFEVEENRRLMRIERKDGLTVFTADPNSPAVGPARVYVSSLPEGFAIVR
jgi:hypothetical protein